jgi:hypothetical protein
MYLAIQTLFTDLSSAESANVSGGATSLSFNLDNYLMILGAAQVFGNPGVTTDEVQAAWKAAIVRPGSGGSSSASGLSVGAMGSRMGNPDLAVP